MENLYEILQVSEKASDEVIEKVYKTLAKKYHPDVAKSKAEAENMMKKINMAYDILSNKEKRSEYDFQLQQERTLAEKKKNENTQFSNPNYASSNVNQYSSRPNDPDYGNYYDYINKFDFSKIKNMDSETKKILMLIGIVILVCIVGLITTLNSLFDSKPENNNKVEVTESYEKSQQDEEEKISNIVLDEVPKKIVGELLQAIKEFNTEGIKKNISGAEVFNESDIEEINKNIEIYKMITDKMTFEYFSSNIREERATVTYKVSNIDMLSIMADVYNAVYMNDTSESIKNVFQTSYSKNINNIKTQKVTLDLVKINGEWKIRLLPTDLVGIIGARFANIANIFRKF